MAQKVSTEAFRSVFRVVEKESLRWFPGHMERGLKQMQNKLRSIDCIVEVHDARIPFSGRNTDFKYKISGVKPHILVLNKFDLISPKVAPQVTEKLKNEYEHIIFTNSKDQTCQGVKKIFPLAQRLIQNTNRFNRASEEDCCLMIIGVPNVGKSSLLNALRVRHLHKGNATHVGATPGITRSVLHKIKIREKPLFYMLDTPGILTPNISSTEIGLKLALCATIEDHQVGETILADYLLYWLNRHQHFQYVQALGLSEPCDDILEVLAQICRNQKKTIRVRDQSNQYVIKPNFEAAASLMLKQFRLGELGRVMLDEDLL